MKKSKKHNIYEVWDENTCESVYVNHRPSRIELLQISLDQQWLGIFDSEEGQLAFIKTLLVEKVHPFYTI